MKSLHSVSKLLSNVNDNSKFSKLDIPAGKEVNHIVNLEKRITLELNILKDKEITDKSTYKKYKTSRFQTRHFIRVI